MKQTLIPHGEYTVIITSINKLINNKTGTIILKFTHEVVEGEHEGKSFIHTTMFRHPDNKKCEEQGRKILKMMMKNICGTFEVDDLKQLINKPHQLVVGQKQDKYFARQQNLPSNTVNYPKRYIS